MAQTDDERIEAAKEAFDGGDFTAVIDGLGPLLKKDGEADPKAKLAQQMAASAHQRRGEDHFKNARIEESVADFTAYIGYYPESEPDHWQRGISFYYAEEYEKGVKQFEIHKTVNPEDVENAAWHFLCAVRAPDGDVKEAQKNLIPITKDTRVPMAEIHLLFAGEITPEEVLEAGGRGGDYGKFYADLYVGLYYEGLGDEEKGLLFIARAAKNPSSQNYMGDVARTHLLVREREAKKREALKGTKPPAE
jgi:lipoprotein NlpI